MSKGSGSGAVVIVCVRVWFYFSIEILKGFRMHGTKIMDFFFCRNVLNRAEFIVNHIPSSSVRSDTRTAHKRADRLCICRHMFVRKERKD